MAFDDTGERCRAFHTEEVGKLDTTASSGNLFVFMCASHDNVQELVGNAGAATCLMPDEPRRAALAQKLGLDRLSQDAWNLKRVQDCHKGDRDEFLRDWARDLKWIPNWVCPKRLFFWPDTLVHLDPMRVKGKPKFLSMFKGDTRLEHGEARTIMGMIPTAARNPAWHNLAGIIGTVEGGPSTDDEIAQDIADVEADTGTNPTTKSALIQARRGQGKFRAGLVRRWGGACAVTGLAVNDALRASHIKPWRASDNKERLDPANGILLAATLDALFDAGLVTFGDDGGMLVSKRVTSNDRTRMGLPSPVRQPLKATEKVFMAHHRKSTFKPG